MSKTFITNDTPKGGQTLASQIGVIVAMEMGRVLGRAEAANEQGKTPIQNTAPLAGAFKLPAGDRPGHVPPKAIHDDKAQPVANHGGVRIGKYLCPKAED